MKDLKWRMSCILCICTMLADPAEGWILGWVLSGIYRFTLLPDKVCPHLTLHFLRAKKVPLINNTSNTIISGVFSVIFPIPWESFGQQSWPVWCHLGASARFPISSSTHRTYWSPVATMKKITERHTEVRLTCFTVTAHEANGAAAVVAVVDDAAGSIIQTWLTGHTFIDLYLAVSTWDQEQQA